MTTEKASLETEVKIKIGVPAKLISKIEKINFVLIQPRIREENVVFDHPLLELKQRNFLLRLRGMESLSVLTLKMPAENQDRDTIYKTRKEWETVIADGKILNEILLSLGFKPFFRYEKYRTVYKKGTTKIMIDETPIGNYIEIEGREGNIDRTATDLGYQKKHYIKKSYHTLFLEARGSGNMCFP